MNAETKKQKKELQDRELVDFGPLRNLRFIHYENRQCNEGDMLALFLMELYDINEYEQSFPENGKNLPLDQETEAIKLDRISKFFVHFFNELKWCTEHENFITIQSFAKELENILLHRKNKTKSNPFKTIADDFFHGKVKSNHSPASLSGKNSLSLWWHLEVEYLENLGSENGFNSDKLVFLLSKHCLPKKTFNQSFFQDVLKRHADGEKFPDYLQSKLDRFKTLREFMELLDQQWLKNDERHVRRTAQKLNLKFKPSKSGRPAQRKRTKPRLSKSLGTEHPDAIDYNSHLKRNSSSET